LETLLSAALRLVHDGRIGLAPLLRSLSTRPAEILGLSAGRLAPGAPADLIVVDTEAPYVLDKTRLRSLSKNSPFDGARLEGRVRKTFVGGRLVYDAAEDDAAGQGAR
jgi:dihydroorotase